MSRSVPLDLISVRRMERAWRHEARRRLECDLSMHERRQFSQNGEDGILEWIFDRFGTTSRWLVEIGASDGEENCTRNLVDQVDRDLGRGGLGACSTCP